ncbi:GNAT family N-acetyltransferase [Gallaecimonas xiamenensis]|uniref:Putative acetyltransferase protein n=1 Tax=Gallaecimonas xiamenensis 3-C-1 TaxID=745411 RepID=K2JXE3_9GAMM|nr:GNAT family N-acetyltransferase [Gallaecimonas xiamenensis]EKE74979.1 Putative acetyltransferase protein [Gallaecimonas xiamenensis 3-C-1]
MEEIAVHIKELQGQEAQAKLDHLAAVLHRCVSDGASVSFIAPFTLEDARGYWRQKVLPRLGGRLRLFVAEADGRVVGTVLLDADTPPNQPHRAEVAKLLVHGDYQRRGIAQALMTHLLAEASAMGLTLLTLDTRTHDKAEPLYRKLGFVTVGVIPAFALSPDGSSLDGTTVMYKQLGQ